MEDNWQDLEIVVPKIDVEELKYKSSSTVAGQNLDNIQGHIIHTASSSNIDAQTRLKDLNNKFK